MSSRITKKKVKTFLTLRFRKEPMMMYDDTLDVAVEVIQDFLNCDPMDIGKLQGATYDTIYNIEREIDDDTASSVDTFLTEYCEEKNKEKENESNS